MATAEPEAEQLIVYCAANVKSVLISIHLSFPFLHCHPGCAVLVQGLPGARPGACCSTSRSRGQRGGCLRYLETLCLSSAERLHD